MHASYLYQLYTVLRCQSFIHNAGALSDDKVNNIRFSYFTRFAAGPAQRIPPKRTYTYIPPAPPQTLPFRKYIYFYKRYYQLYIYTPIYKIYKFIIICDKMYMRARGLLV